MKHIWALHGLIIGISLGTQAVIAGYHENLLEQHKALREYDKNYRIYEVDSPQILESPSRLLYSNYVIDKITPEVIQDAQDVFHNYNHLCLVDDNDEASKKVMQKVIEETKKYKMVGNYPQMQIDLTTFKTLEKTKFPDDFSIIPVKKEEELTMWAQIVAQKYGNEDELKKAAAIFMNKENMLLLLGMLKNKPVATINAFLGKKTMGLYTLVAPNKTMGWKMVEACLKIGKKSDLNDAILLAVPTEHEYIKEHFQQTGSYNVYRSEPVQVRQPHNSNMKIKRKAFENTTKVLKKHLKQNLLAKEVVTKEEEKKTQLAVELTRIVLFESIKGVMGLFSDNSLNQDEKITGEMQEVLKIAQKEIMSTYDEEVASMFKELNQDKKNENGDQDKKQ